MELLIRRIADLIFLLLFQVSSVYGASLHSDLCESAKEFREAHQYLIKEKDFPLAMKVHLDLALRISKGCSGATRRFAIVYELFKKAGVDLKLSLEAGLKFSTLSDAQTNNFVEIFPQIYLRDFFDLDFMSALNMTIELAEISHGSAEQIKADFTKISKFCLDDKSVGLSVQKCAELTFFVARQSQFFVNGAAGAFLELYDYLRNNPKTGLSVRESLEVLHQIFKYGPLAPVNFKEGFEYAIATSGPQTKVSEALAVGIALAQLSSKTMPPPLAEHK